MLYAVAAQRGVAAILAESGGRGLLIEEDVARHVRGVMNILRAVGSLAGEPERVAPPRAVKSFEWLGSPVGGIFHCGVAVAQEVRTGDVVGDLTGLAGEPLATVTAPTHGGVLFSVTRPAIKQA